MVLLRECPINSLASLDYNIVDSFISHISNQSPGATSKQVHPQQDDMKDWSTVKCATLQSGADKMLHAFQSCSKVTLLANLCLVTLMGFPYYLSYHNQ